MRGPTWTKEEDEILTKLLNEGKTNQEIADLMNKPRGGVKSRRKALGLKTRFFHEWTQEQQKYIFDNCEKSDEELAKDLNIDFWAVRNFKNKHNLREKINKWQKDEVELLKMLLPFCTHSEIAKILGRTTHSIKRYCESRGLLTQPPPREIHIGDKFERLTVTSERYIKKFKHGSYGYIKVKCDCGSPEKEVQINALFSGSTLSCGCYAKEKAKRTGTNNPKFKHINEVPLLVFNIAKSNAKKIGREFTITHQYIADLWIKQKGRCALTGVQLKFYPRLSQRYLGTASLDRIDSTKGYIEGNVQWTHKIINLVKQDLPEFLFTFYCSRISNPVLSNIPSRCLKRQIVIYGKKTGFAGTGNCALGFLNIIKERAKVKKLEFNLTTKIIWDLLIKQNGYCALSQLSIPLHRNFNSNRLMNLCSVDRIDNKKGYTIDNIQLIHKDLQPMRRDMPLYRFKYWCKLRYEFVNKIPNGINGL